MESKYLTKATLVALNKKAEKAGGNYIAPEFVERLPVQLKYPVWMALPFAYPRGWIRCNVIVGPDSDHLHTLLLDMPGEVFAKLPAHVEMAQKAG